MMLLRDSFSRLKGTSHTLAELRLAKDFEELMLRRYSAGVANIYISLPYTQDAQITIPVSFQLKEDQEHLYRGAWFHCLIIVSSSYPSVPPKVYVVNRVFHPNVDIETGEFFIEALTVEEWKRVLTINSVIFAIESLLYEPNFDYFPLNSLNIDMANMSRQNFSVFCETVTQVLKGGWFFDYYFEPNFGGNLCKKRKRPEEINFKRKL